MQWYWWALICWVLSGTVALAMDFRDRPEMRENIGWSDVAPAILGPLWLIFKMWEWYQAWGART